ALLTDEPIPERCRAADATQVDSDTRFGDHRILMLAEDVLELLGLVGESRGGAPHFLFRKLGRVPGVLHLDPHIVELTVARLPRQRLQRLSSSLELAGRDLREREIRRQRARGSPPLIEATEETAGARAVQSPEHAAPRARMLDVEASEEVVGRRWIRDVLEGVQLLAQVIPQNVEVADRAQALAEPVELAPERFHPGTVEHVPESAQERAKPANGRAHL